MESAVSLKILFVGNVYITHLCHCLKQIINNQLPASTILLEQFSGRRNFVKGATQRRIQVKQPVLYEFS